MSPTVWFEKDYPKLIEFQQFEDEFGNDDSIILAIHQPKGLLTPESIELIQILTERFWQLKDIIRVDSLTNHQWAHSNQEEIIIESLFPKDEPYDFKRRKEVALSDKTIEGYLINKTGTTALLYGKLKPSFGDKLHHTSVYDDVRQMTQEFRQSHPSYKFYISGVAATHGALDHLIFSDFFTLVPLLVIIIALIIYWLFQSILISISTLLVVIFSITSTIGLACWLNIPIDPLTTSVPQILVAIGVADSMHLLSSFFIYLKKGSSPQTSIYKAIHKNITPTVLTTITTIVGFLSLYSSNILPIKRLGLLTALGGSLAWIFTFLLIPPLILFFSSRLSKPPKKRLFLTHSAALNLVSYIKGHRLKIILIFFFLSTAGLLLATQNIVDSDPSRYLKESHFVRQSGQFISQQIGSTTVLEIIVDSGETDGAKKPAFLHKVDKFSNWVSEHPNVTKVISAIDIIKDVNKSMNSDNPSYRKIPENKPQVADSLFLYSLSLPQGMDLSFWMTIDYRKIRLSTWWKVNSTKDALQTLSDFQKKADELGLTIQQTGKGGLTTNLGPLTVSTFFKSMLLTLLFVFLMMTLIFKSLRLGLISMLPNIIPLVIGGGIMKLMGFPLDIGTAIVTAVALGIAVDDTIHIFEEYQKYQKLGYSTEDSLAHCFQHSGRALFLTTLLLTVGFLSFTAGQFVPTIEFGIMNAIVISLALLTDLLLLPALLMTLPKLRKSE